MKHSLVRLGDICTVVSGSTPKSGISDYWDGDVVWITPAELTEDSYIINDSVRHITQKAVQETSLKPFPAGTVILSSRAPIGKTAIAGREMYCNQGFKNLICSSRVNNKYLYFFLSCKTEYLNSLGRGATFKEISKTIVENIEIPLPGIPEQKRIATEFEHIQGLEQGFQKQVSFFDQLVKSQFVEMFGDPVRNPFGWSTRPLLEMGYCKNGMNFHTGDRGIEMHCLGVGDFKNYSVIDGTDNLPIVSLNESPPEESMLQDGDIVFVRSNGNKALVGRCLVVYPRSTPTTYSGFCIRYRLTSDEVNTSYLLRVLKTDSMRERIAGRGANIQNLNQQILATLEIPTPPMKLQERFAAFVAQVDKSKFSCRRAGKVANFALKCIMEDVYGVMDG